MTANNSADHIIVDDNKSLLKRQVLRGFVKSRREEILEEYENKDENFEVEVLINRISRTTGKQKQLERT